MESILIFGGGENQRTLIQTARQLGYMAVVIDPNPLAIARREADVFEVIDAKDKAGTVAIAKKYSVKGIITCQMENPLLLMAEIAEDMGFIFPSGESVQKARNKWLMKQAFISNNVPCAKGFLYKHKGTKDFLRKKELTFPSIIKPLDSYSSRGVYKINTVDDILKYLKDTQKYSTTGDIIIEEFMDGPEVSVESVTQNGITEVIQITDKVITPYPNTVEMAHIQPSRHEPEIQKAIKAIVIKGVKSLGLDNCATHTEVKITSQGVKMVEIGARLGGDFITSHLVPLSTGVNIEAAAIQIAMGRKPDLLHKFSKGAVIQYFDLPEGKKIMNIGEWGRIFSNPNVKHAIIVAKQGDVIPAITDSAKRIGFVILQGNSREETVSQTKQTVYKIISDIITQ